METAENDKDTSLEAMLARGEILDIGVVEILPDEEPEIPVHLYTEEAIVQGNLPDLLLYRGGLENENVTSSEEPVVPAEMSVKSSSKYSVTARDAQERLKSLPERLRLEESGIGRRIANIFAVTTERQKIQAFGDYLADSIRRTPCDYIDPAGFVSLVNIAVINLQKGFECGTNRPVRQSVREVLSGKDKVFYDDLLSRVPQIARAIAATCPGFVSEVDEIYDAAGSMGKKPFQYALGLKNGQDLDHMARADRYGRFR